MKKLLAVVLSALMLATMLAGCGGANSTPANNSVSAPAAPPVDLATWKEADATESFTYHVSAAATTLHKWAATANNTSTVMNYLLFDPLLIYDEEGGLQPWLAESYEMAEDYTSITMKLRDDAYFTDGTKISADDCVFVFETMRDDTEHCPDSVVKNWRNYLGEIEKVDELTFTIHFAKPMPEFWKLVTDPSVQVYSKAAYEKMGYDAFWQAPVGTGAYVVESWDAANSVCKFTLRTDEKGYWGYDATGTYTNVKNITVQYSPEGQTRLASLRSGEVQMIDTVPTTDKAALDGEGFVTHIMPPVNYVFLQTASAKGDIFDNQKLREALSLSIDRQLLVDTLLDGYAIPVEWPCLPTDLGYSDKVAYEYNPEKAKQLVAESGYKGEAIDFIFTASTVNIGNELTQAIQSMAKDVGINLQIRMLEVAVYDEARTNHDYDLCLAAIANSGNMWYKTAADVIGSDRFNTGYQNEALKALGISMQTEMDPTKADNILRQMYEIETVDFAPNLYLYWPTTIGAWNGRVSGVLLHNNQIPDLHALVMS